MRKIRFRALTRESREMVYGYYADGFIMDFENDLSYKVDSDTLGQYIGLKDKNDVEIYEGDILLCEYGDKVGKVYFDEDELAYVIEIDNSVYNIGDHYYPKDVEVIGNIYDNKELLSAG